MKVTPIIMENFLLVILTTPLADQSLVMNLYRVHNSLALHPKLHVQFSTSWRVNIRTIIITFRHADMAQSLDGYLWAVSSLKEEKMRIRCLEDSHLEDIKPPLTIIHIGNGCEGYNSNLFIPAKSELTSEDETLTRHVFFLEFIDEYQDLTKYSLIQQLNLPQLTAEELENLPN